MTDGNEDDLCGINKVTILDCSTEDEIIKVQSIMTSFVKGEDVVFFSQGCPDMLNGKSKFLGGQSGVVLSASNYLFDALQQENDQKLRLSEIVKIAKDDNRMSNICTDVSEQDFQTNSCYISFVQVYKEKIYDLLEPLYGHRALPLKKDLYGNVIIKGVKEIQVRNSEAVKTNLEFGNINAKQACRNYEYNSNDCHYLFIMKLKANSQTISMCIFCDLAHHNENRTKDTFYHDSSLRAVQKHIDILCSNALPQFSQDQRSLPISSRSILMRLSLRIFQGNGKILMIPCPHTVKKTIQSKDFNCPKQHTGNSISRGKKTMKTEKLLRTKIDEQEQQLREKDGTIEDLRKQIANFEEAMALMKHQQEVAKHNLDEKECTLLTNLGKLEKKDLQCEEMASMLKNQLEEKTHCVKSLQTHIQHLQELQALHRQSIADKEALLEKERMETIQLKKMFSKSLTSFEIKIKEKEQLLRNTTARLLSKEKTTINLQRRTGGFEGRNIEQATKVSWPFEDNGVMSKKIKTEDLEDCQNVADCSSQPAENHPRCYKN